MPAQIITYHLLELFRAASVHLLEAATLNGTDEDRIIAGVEPDGEDARHCAVKVLGPELGRSEEVVCGMGRIASASMSPRGMYAAYTHEPP